MSAECSAETISPGYKQTEVGVIPEDWDVKKLGEVVDIDADNLSAGTSVDYAFNYISLEDVDEGLLRSYSSQIFGSAPSRARRRLRYGDVLVSTVRPNLKSHLLFGQRQGEWICSTGFSVVRCKNSSAVPSYIFSHLFATTITKQIESLLTGSNYPAINGKDVKALLIPLPPTLAEQEAIAEALSDTDALIESLEQLIAKKRQIKQGAMQELLTGKRRLPGFRVKLGYKQTEVGVIPEDWEVKRLEEIADVIDPHPSHRAPPEVTNGIPFVGIGDLKENGDIIGNEVRMVDPSVFDEHQKRYDLKEELIGLGRVASIGKVVKIRFTGNRYTISPTLGVIRGTKVKRDYLLYALKIKTIADQFNKIMSGSTRSSVGMIVLRKLDIIFPSDSDEQNAIATILSDMDYEITALEEKLAKARQLKQGMMQELLTGKIRLI